MYLYTQYLGMMDFLYSQTTIKNLCMRQLCDRWHKKMRQALYYTFFWLITIVNSLFKMSVKFQQLDWLQASTVLMDCHDFIQAYLRDSITTRQHMKVFTSEIYSFQNRDFFRLLQNRYRNQQDKNQEEGFCKRKKFEEEKFVTVLIIDSAPEILKK